MRLIRKWLGWWLPCLACAQMGGVLLADGGWLASRDARGLGIACALAGVAGRSAGWMAACSLGLFVALGAHGLATRLETAGFGPHATSVRSERAFDIAVEGWVCAVDARADWIAVELCDVTRVPFGPLDAAASPDGAPRAPLPPRLRFVERFPSPEGDVLATLGYGDALRVGARIRPVRWLSNPGGRASPRAAARRGIGVRAALVDPTLVARLPGRDRGELLGPVLSLRARIGERLESTGPGGPLLRALATGERAALGKETITGFTQLGLLHLLSVSGLHLALTAGAAFALLFALLTRIPILARRFDVRPFALVGALALALAYALLAGFDVPVRRSLVLVAVAVARFVAGRGRTSVHALALAAIVVLAWEPDALFAPGAQLSFVATAALLLATPPALAPGAVSPAAGVRLGRWLASAVPVSATAIVVTTPLLAWHGMSVGSLGLLANAVAVPWTAAVLLPAAQLGALIVVLPVPEALAAPLLVCAELVGRVSLAAVATAASEGGAALAAVSGLGAEEVPRAFAPAVLGAAILFALLSLATRRAGVRVALAAALPLVLRLSPTPALAPAPPRLVVFDVGQGDAILVEGRHGRLLVDGGFARPGGPDLGRTALLPALAALGVDALDVVVASHADADHRGGLEAILAALPVRELWLPNGSRRAPDFSSLLAVAEQRGVRVRERAAGEPPERVGDVAAAILWPPAEAFLHESAAAPDRNDGSLVLRVELGGRAALLTGDIGRAAEGRLLVHAAERGATVRADVLKLAHHGSRGSSSEAFLDAVGASVAVVSAACVGHAGLPTREALGRVRTRAAATWWTGRDGAVFVAFAGAGEPLLVFSQEDRDRCRMPAARL